MKPEQLKEYQRRFNAKEAEVIDTITDALMATYREVTGNPYDDKLADDIHAAIRSRAR